MAKFAAPLTTVHIVFGISALVFPLGRAVIPSRAAAGRQSIALAPSRYQRVPLTVSTVVALADLLRFWGGALYVSSVEYRAEWRTSEW